MAKVYLCHIDKNTHNITDSKMNNDKLLEQVTAKAQSWLGDGYDEETKAEVRRMLEADDKTELIESFYKDLEFGTGGLRGIMGAGSNRMNIYTVGAATQGLANYLHEAFPDMPQISVAVGHDVRHNSRRFADSSVARAVSTSPPAIIPRNTTDTRLTGATAHR